MPSFLTPPPSGFGISTRLTGCGLIGPAQQLFPYGWPVLFQKLWQFVDGHPIHARASFVGLDSCQCLLAVSRSQTSSINCSPMARLSVPRVPASDSAPSADT